MELIICKSQKTKYSIVISSECDDSVRAANILKNAFEQITGVDLRIVSDTDTPFSPYEIIVGKTNREDVCFSYDREDIMEIGYTISVSDDRLILNGGEFNGATFAVYEFIKRFLRYDPLHIYQKYPKLDTVSVPHDFYFENSPRSWIENIPERKSRGTHIYMIPTFLRPKNGTSFRGMGYIIRSANDKIMVIDSGHTSEGTVIVELLRRLTGKDVPEVEAWFMTHLHNDHIDAFLHIGEQMSDSVKVKCFYHNIPSEEYCARWGEQSHFDRLSALRKNGFCQFKRLATGDKISFDGVDVEVVYAFDRELEEYLNERITASEISINKPNGDAINNSDTLYKVTADGHSALFIGDFMHFGEDFLYERHPEIIPKLKADMIQVGHHGANFLSQKFYHHVNARIALWSTTHDAWLFSEGSLKSIRRRLYQLRLLKNYVAADGIHPIPFDMSEITDEDRSYFEAELEEIEFSGGVSDSILISHKYDYTLFVENNCTLTVNARSFNKGASVSFGLNGAETKNTFNVRHGDIIGITVKHGELSRRYTYKVLPHPEKREILRCDIQTVKEKSLKISSRELEFGSGEFTLSVWIKPDEVNAPSTICYYGDRGEKSPHYSLSLKTITPSSHKPQIGAPLFTICDPIDKKVIDLYASHTLKAGEWAHIAVVHENINQKIYINGKFSCERSYGHYVDVAGKNELLIGCAPNGEAPFLGEIGEFSLYNYSMSDDEINMIYRQEII